MKRDNNITFTMKWHEGWETTLSIIKDVKIRTIISMA